MIQQDHLQVFDLTLKTQSPLFVGSGRKIGKREYIYSPNQGCVKILNMELFFDYMLRHDLVRQFEKFMLSSNSSLLDFWTRDCHLAEDWLEHPKLMGDKPLVQYRLAVTEDVAGYNGTKEIPSISARRLRPRLYPRQQPERCAAHGVAGAFAAARDAGPRQKTYSGSV